MKNLQAIKVGNVINVSLNGQFFKKTCEDNNEALELYKKVIDIKNNYDEEKSPIEIIGLFNKMKRVLVNAHVEYTEHDNQYYLKGYNTPIPEDIVNIISEYDKHGFPLDPILNFWELLMLNPDKEVHESLFNYLSYYNFMINDDGYFIGYKAVGQRLNREKVTKEVSSENVDIIVNAYQKIKRWKKSPKNYLVYDENGSFTVVDIKKDNHELNTSIGTLEEVYEQIEFNGKLTYEETKPFFIDKHTGTMRIDIGVPQTMDRLECDNNPSNPCSRGLHVGTPYYARGFASSRDRILICLVNPMNVVAVPNNDAEKLRTCEYIPIGEAEVVNGELKTIEGSYIDKTFTTHEKEQIEKMAENVKANQGTLGDDRNVEELKKMYNNRLLKLNKSL
ncbi:MAG: hypothetical protein ACOCVF_00930 [bacterium]